MKKKLIFMRHANAQLDHLGIADKERSLTIDGFQEIDNVKAQLGDIFNDIDLVYCSNAKRTRQTLGAFTSLMSSKIEIIYDDSLYQATMPEIWSKLQQTNEDTKCVLLLGHNPALSQALHAIAHAHGQVISGLPTCGVAICSMLTTWANLSLSTIIFEKIIYP